MALSLDATLAAAQDNVSRRPLVEILSSSPAADIPFDGQKLTTESTAETAPNAITHSSGRLCVVYTFGSGVSAQLKYVYTDTDRSTFSFVTVAAAYLLDASLCEMGDGNIGIVCLTKDGTNYYLKTLILSPTGSVVSWPDYDRHDCRVELGRFPGGLPAFFGDVFPGLRLQDGNHLFDSEADFCGFLLPGPRLLPVPSGGLLPPTEGTMSRCVRRPQMSCFFGSITSNRYPGRRRRPTAITPSPRTAARRGRPLSRLPPIPM